MTAQTRYYPCSSLYRVFKVGLILIGLPVAGFFTVALTPAVAASSSKPLAIIPVKQTAAWTRSWRIPRHTAKEARVRRGDVGLLMIGDSITCGWETAGREVWRRYYEHRRAVNLGFNGDFTEHVLWRLMIGELEGIAPKQAVVMIGTNNSSDGRAPGDTAAGIRRIVQELRWRLPTTNILLRAIFSTGATPDNEVRRTNRKVNRGIAHLHDGRQVFFLDLSHVFLDRRRNLPRGLMPDLLNPNSEGYRRWAEEMEPVVHLLMGDEAVVPPTDKPSGSIPSARAAEWPPPADARAGRQALLGADLEPGRGDDAIR